MPYYLYDTEFGPLGLCESQERLTRLYLPADILPTGEELCETPFLRAAFTELREYLAGARTAFTIPLSPEGTPFQQRVWSELVRIPYGETATYRQIAERIGNPLAYRAVGMANHVNPIPIFIPCHRVVGVSGALTGYRGGIEMKQRLLELESQNADLSIRASGD